MYIITVKQAGLELEALTNSFMVKIWKKMVHTLLQMAYILRNILARAVLAVDNFCHLDQGDLGECFLTLPNSLSQIIKVLGKNMLPFH